MRRSVFICVFMALAMAMGACSDDKKNDEKSCDRIWCFVSERVKVPEINWKRHGEFYEYESGFSGI